MSASMESLCPKDIIKEISDIEQILSDTIEMLSKVDLQLAGQENVLENLIKIYVK